jgi:drug/metabolite transporter (DMT)-like permease
MVLGVLCGAAAALCWAAGFVAVRRGLDHGLLPADIALHRFVWMGLLLLPVLALSPTPIGPARWAASPQSPRRPPWETRATRRR